MPQNTPMKRQFTTIDGRTVMSNLPQHWGGNDWKITGVDNPLPVGNYVQTEAGVWIPQKGSDDGAADVRLIGRKVEKIFVFNAVTIDTTKELDSQIFDVSKFQQIHVLAQNTLNADLTIRMRIDGIWVRSEDDPQGSWTLATIKPHVNYTYSLNTYKPYLFQNVINTVQFVIKAENPPTSGSVTIKILGGY